MKLSVPFSKVKERDETESGQKVHSDLQLMTKANGRGEKQATTSAKVLCNAVYTLSCSFFFNS